MEEKKESDKTLTLKSDHKEQILKYLAWLIKPFTLSYESYDISRTLNISKEEVELLIKELQEENAIFPLPPENGREAQHMLKAEIQLQLLLDIKNSHKKPCYAVPPRRYPTSNWRKEEWVICLQNYLTGKDIQSDIPYYAEYAPIRYLLMYMPTIPEWMPFFKKIPSEVISTLFYEYKYVWDTALLPPNITCLTRGYFENESLSPERREKYKTHFALYQYVFSGRINEIPDHVPADIPEGMCLHAIYHQYKGEISEPLELYSAALKGLSSKYFSNALLNLFYTIALINDFTAESKKKMANLFKRDYLPSELLPAQLLGLYSMNEKLEDAMSYIRYGLNDFSPLIKVLLSLLIRHFRIDKSIKIKDEDIQHILDDDNLKLLQLECSQDFLPYTTQAESLKQELGLSPILPPFHKVNEWERVLTLLMAKAKERPQKEQEKSKSESQSRIVYRIDKYNHIIPYLQKSKDGTSWSKGRIISLTTFQQGMPEMNEMDRILTTYVKHLPTNWGEKERWLLYGPKPLMLLAGYPLVFSEEHPDKPVNIRKEEPEVIVRRVKEGFKMEGNVDPHKIEGNYMLKKENDSLLRVIELPPFQRDVMIAISRISVFPKQAEKRLTEVLRELSQCITVHSDLIEKQEDLQQKTADSQITIRLQPMGEGFTAEFFVKPFSDHPTYCKAGKGPISVIDNADGEKVQAVRDLDKEEKHLKEILEWLHPIIDEYDETEDRFYFKNTTQCLQLLDILQEHTNDIHIEWPEKAQLSIKKKINFQDIQVTVEGIGQWFEVTGKVQIDNKAMLSITDLMQKVRESKSRFIPLSKTEFLAVSEKLRKQLLAIDALMTHTKNKLQLPLMAVESLVELEALGVNIKKDVKFQNIIRRIEEANTQQYPLPKNLQAELKDYQTDGFQWMSRLAHWGAGACLADDMGVGKTLQAIAFMLAHASEGPSLVVAPASVLFNWKCELERFAPSLTPLFMHEPGCDRKAVIEHASSFDIVLITYGLLTNEIDSLADKEWNSIILDEAHNIKNKDAKMSKAALQLKGNFRLLLTGTPLQNHLAEIWSLFQFANPGLLGTFAQFNEKFIQPIEKYGDKEKQRLLKKILSPFILRRTKTDVLDELPVKTEITLRIDLNEDERALYENLRMKILNSLEDGSISTVQAMADITKLRLAACHPALITPALNIISSKSETLIRLIEKLMKNNHRALVFSQFTSHLALIREDLNKAGIDYLYMDGNVSAEERNKLVKKFQTEDQPLFLISLKAGGTGLNLTAADFVIHLDPWWNPAIEDQASDRVHRLGQTRPVTIYRLIAAQTIEEKIIKLHQSKKSLAASLLEGSDLPGKLTKEEILELLKRAN